MLEQSCSEDERLGAYGTGATMGNTPVPHNAPIYQMSKLRPQSRVWQKLGEPRSEKLEVDHDGMPCYTKDRRGSHAAEQLDIEL